MLKNSWVRHLILVLYLFQFLFITREYWRGTKDFFSIVANHSICKNKNQWMNFAHEFLCIYSILSMIFQSRAKTAMELLNELNDDVNGCYEDEVCIFKKVCCIVLVTLIFWISFDDSLHFTCRIRRLCSKTTQNSSRNLQLL